MADAPVTFPQPSGLTYPTPGTSETSVRPKVVPRRKRRSRFWKTRGQRAHLGAGRAGGVPRPLGPVSGKGGEGVRCGGRAEDLLNGCGSKPMVRFWGGCTSVLVGIGMFTGGTGKGPMAKGVYTMYKKIVYTHIVLYIYIYTCVYIYIYKCQEFS